MGGHCLWKLQEEPHLGRGERNTGNLSAVNSADNGEGTSNTTADKVAKKASNDSKKQKAVKTRDTDVEERSRVTVVAIVACSVVALLAILICLVLMLGSTPPVRMVQIPGLVGQHFDQLPQYSGLVIVQQKTEYSNEHDKGKIIHQEPAAGTYHDEGTVVSVVVSLGKEPAPAVMAPWVGEELQDAREFLDNLKIGLYILVREEHSTEYSAGTITRTKPAEGEDLSKGQTVILWVSLGPKVVKATMPNLISGTGMTMERAELILNNNGFYNIEWVPVDSLAAEGTVLSQSVAANVEVDVNTLIVLEYSTGIAPTEPTDPSDPSGPEVTSVEQTFILPSAAESYTLRIEMEGDVVLADTVIQPGQTELTLTLTGSGTVNCTLYINGEIYETVAVSFEADE